MKKKEKLKLAKTEISMIGCIAFDFPWRDLKDVLSEKFKQDNFLIQILRESETTIAQYSLLTVSQEDEEDFSNLSRGNLLGIKDEVIKELKQTLSEATGEKNI